MPACDQAHMRLPVVDALPLSESCTRSQPEASASEHCKLIRQPANMLVQCLQHLAHIRLLHVTPAQLSHSLRSESRLSFRLPLQASRQLPLQGLAVREAFGDLLIPLHLHSAMGPHESGPDPATSSDL